MPLDGTQLSEVTQILIEGKKLIEEDGWCQGSYRRGRQVCMEGAVLYSDCFWYSNAYQQANMLLYEAVGRQRTTTWNDTPGRTKDDVLAAYDRAIASSMA